MIDLDLLLSKNQTFTDDILQKIADDFIAECEEKQLFPWRYYYIKYPVFRPGSYGKLSNRNAAEQPYMFAVMQTRSMWSQNTYMPYLKEADEAHLSRDDMGMRLIYGDQHIVCRNDSYLLRNNDNEDEPVETLTIRQNEEGIDTEDRVIRLKEYLAENFL